MEERRISDIDCADCFFTCQRKLFLWIQAQELVKWTQIHKVCLSLVSALPDKMIDYFGGYPEYKLFMPLLNNGICEVSGDSFYARYISREEMIQKESVAPLKLLSNIPDLQSLVESFPDASAENQRYIWNPTKKGYIYRPTNSNTEIGIYKESDKVYRDEYLYTGKRFVKINKKQSLDALRVARCYVRANTEKCPLFVFYPQTKELACLRYGELPVLILRALILFDKSQLINNTYYRPMNFKDRYHNIDFAVIRELKRIMGENTVGVHND